jgi:hypothetical protein
MWGFAVSQETPSRRYHYIIENECPITRDSVEQIQDPVVFNHRLYSRHALLTHFVNQFDLGKTTITDPMTNGEVLELPRRFFVPMESFRDKPFSVFGYSLAGFSLLYTFYTHYTTDLPKDTKLFAFTFQFVLLIFFLNILRKDYQEDRMRVDDLKNSRNARHKFTQWLEEVIEPYDSTAHLLRDQLLPKDVSRNPLSFYPGHANPRQRQPANAQPHEPSIHH